MQKSSKKSSTKIAIKIREWESYFKSEFDWWKDGYMSFARIALLMEQKGFKRDDIKTMLSDLYSVVASEFGD